MLYLKLHIIHWTVVIIHDIAPLKECIVFYSLKKLSVELVFELKCKLARLLLRHLAVFFILFKFYVDLMQKVCLLMIFCAFHRCR